MLKNYESMIVITPDLSNDDAKKENEKITSFITKNKGSIDNTDEWGKKKLAYEIRKFKEGFYFVNYIQFDPEKISELERTYRINENIIRYNILVKEKKGGKNGS